MNPSMQTNTNNLQSHNTRVTTANSPDKLRMSNLNNAKISSNTNYELKDSGFSSNFLKNKKF
jgi:hypothetical protein